MHCSLIRSLMRFGPYSKQLGILNCMCNFLKAYLLCKFVTNFNGFEWFLISLTKFLFYFLRYFKLYIYIIYVIYKLWVQIFLSLFITLRTNVRMSIIPSPFSFLFSLHLEWSHNKSIDNNQIFIFANICSTLVCGSYFLQLGSTFCRNAQKEGEKS